MLELEMRQTQGMTGGDAIVNIGPAEPIHLCVPVSRRKTIKSSTNTRWWSLFHSITVKELITLNWR